MYLFKGQALQSLLELVCGALQFSSRQPFVTAILEANSQEVKLQVFRHLRNLSQGDRHFQIFLLLDCDFYWACFSVITGSSRIRSVYDNDWKM